MNYLTLEYIKAHSRIDYNIEDTILTLYAESAETIVMDMCNTTYAKMVATYGQVPKPIIHATLMLVDWSYQQRSPVSSFNLWAVPYTFDMLIKPYIRLVDDDSSS